MNLLCNTHRHCHDIPPPQRPCRRRVGFTLFVLVCTAFTTAWGQAGALRGFVPNSEYVMSVDGKEESRSQIYFSQSAAAFLIFSSHLPTAILVRPRDGVRAVPSQNLRHREDGSLELQAGSELTHIAGLRMVDQEIAFSVEGKEVRLKQKGPLIGTRNLGELLSHSPQYTRQAAAYTPDAATVAKLQAQDRHVRVRVFFGSWCHVCKTYLPNNIKVEQELNGSKVRFEYFGLARPPGGWQHSEVRAAEVKSLPTAVVYVDGRETGRYVGSAGFKQPEKSLLKSIR